MKPRNASALAVAIAGLALSAAPANAAISIVNEVKGFLGSTKTQVCTAHNGTTQVSYDATGVGKLVVVIGTESGFNNQKVTGIAVSFNGAAMTRAVWENTHDGVWDGGAAAIFYLDSPFQGVATFSVSATTSGGGLNGGLVSIIGLAGTAAGVGNNSSAWFTQTAAGNVAVSLTTSAADSLVIAGVENSGRNNAAGTPTVVAPLTLIHNGSWGNQWGGVASGRQPVTASGTTITPTFTANAGGNIHVIAAEFVAEGDPPGSGGTMLIVR